MWNKKIKFIWFRMNKGTTTEKNDRLSYDTTQIFLFREMKFPKSVKILLCNVILWKRVYLYLWHVPVLKKTITLTRETTVRAYPGKGVCAKRKEFASWVS